MPVLTKSISQFTFLFEFIPKNRHYKEYLTFSFFSLKITNIAHIYPHKYAPILESKGCLMNRLAKVLFKDKVAGQLEEVGQSETRFTYDPVWKDTIACSLPVSQADHLWRNGLHPFFEHLAPEGWLREKQAKAAGIAGQDDFGLLLQYGRDCIGAVGLVPVVQINNPQKTDDPVTNAAVGAKRTLSGVQRKALVFLKEKKFYPSGENDPATHIAKFNDKDQDTLVSNESLSLTLASEVLGPREVTNFQVANIEEFSEDALIVHRFDRGTQGEKFRLEDFAQILNKPRGRDFSGKYDASYEELAKGIRKYSVRPEIDVEKFFRRVLLSVIIGNADAHLKNFSLLETADGLRLSPTYDLLNSLVYHGQYDREIALSIGGDRPLLDTVDGEQLKQFGIAIGLPSKAVALAQTDIINKVRNSSILRGATLNEPGGFRDSYTEIVRIACDRVAIQ